MSDSTFSDFNADFYQRFPDLSIFDCGDINLTKVVLDGLKVDYVGSGGFSTDFEKPLWLQKVKRRLRSLRKRPKQNHKPDDRKILLVSTGRISFDQNKHPVLFYFENILKHYGQENCVVMTTNIKHSDLDIDAFYADLMNWQKCEKLTDKDVALLKQVQSFFRRMKTLGRFSTRELGNVRMALDVFMAQYLTMSKLLNRYPELKVAHFDRHYHREGILLALKKLNIRTEELQHGLIAKEDIFYVFPKAIESVRHRALFPDRIWTFGPHWKEILETGYEFSEEKIEVLGDFTFRQAFSYEDTAGIRQFKGSDPLILVATQTFLHGIFIDYIERMLKDLDFRDLKHKILIKPHPLEDSSHYQLLGNHSRVCLTDQGIDALYPLAEMQISIYSTTLYEGLRHRVPGYALDAPACKDYVDAVVKAGVATRLPLDRFPYDVNHTETSKAAPERFYAPANLDALTKP